MKGFVVLGGAGDLTFRYLLPALAELESAGHLPEGLEVVAVARADFDDDSYRQRARDGLADHGDIPADSVATLLARLRYVRGDATDVAVVRAALPAGDEPVLAYLALPPTVFADAIDALRDVGLPAGSRLVVEKPFGNDLDHAAALNARLHRCLPEEAVFRIDHFLGLQTARNILGLRFANRAFEPLWGAAHVERVEITWDETLALEGRAGYYDGSGALRDMVQNHLLQLLCLVAMEPPVALTARDLRDAKVMALRAVRHQDAEAAARASRRARYGAGRIDGRDVRAYVDEDGVDAANDTETFAEVTLFVDTWRWHGVPFVLRSGKALGADRHEVVLRLRPVPQHPFGTGDVPPNVLRFTIDPDRISLEVQTAPAASGDVVAVSLDNSFPPPALSAYAHLLLDALGGETMLSIRDDEAEESWRIVTPVLDAWRRGLVPMEEYAAGSAGPADDG